MSIVFVSRRIGLSFLHQEKKKVYWKKKKMRRKTANSLLENEVKTGSKMPAHSTTMLQSVHSCDSASLVVEGQLDRIREINYECWVVGRLQLLFGARISEVLSITGSSIDARGRVVIKGQKGSESRLVVDTQLRNWWLSMRVMGNDRVFSIDRFYVYRVYKSVGLQSDVEGHKYKAVTHYPRHLFIKSVQLATNDIEQTRQITGHKAVSNTKRYWKSKTK